VRRVSIVLAALIVLVSLASSPNFRSVADDAERTPYAGDFLHEWVGGHIVRGASRDRLYDPDYFVAVEHDAALLGFRLRRDRYIPMVYPPVYYLLVSPLAALPYREAAWLWTALTLAAFAVAASLLARELGDDRRLEGPEPAPARVRRMAGIMALPFAVAFVPFAENLVSGQKATFWLLIFTVTLIALRRGRPFVAGLVFGVLAVKPQLALVVPAALLVKGQWRFAIGAGLTASVAVLLSLAMGHELAAAYVRFAAEAGDFIRRQPDYLHRVHGLYGFFTLLSGEPTPSVRYATLVAVALVACWVARLLRGPIDTASPRFLVQFSGLVLATLLVSPHLLTYDLTVLLLPFAACGTLVVQGLVPRRRRRLVLWSLVALYVACGVGPTIARVTHVQLTTPCMLAVLASLALDDVLPRGVDVAPALRA
jgi:hypothetical protein